ncbi:hypothetical protein GCM10025868_27700 [Angustibacter aerolatus]|uniref:Next to BRCA1 central domain-containing protein n=1 Tax=Angustibacter aerolatus TaxID=1162965 RepID=A0ABQ6JL57_9ACTN|nr:hypothetical protein GCM10025868_27700 [Angustibacter aerolatus]
MTTRRSSPTRRCPTARTCAGARRCARCGGCGTPARLDWRGYALHRVDLPETRDQCQTIPDVRVPDTAAGKTVDVAVDVVVPMRPGFCFVRFKMLDDEGQQAFPGNRPVNFQPAGRLSASVAAARAFR